MEKIRFDRKNAAGFVAEHEMEYLKADVLAAKEKLLSRTAAGNDFLGWIDLPVDYDKEEFVRIKKAAEKIRSDSEVLLVIGEDLKGDAVAEALLPPSCRETVWHNGTVWKC